MFVRKPGRSHNIASILWELSLLAMNNDTTCLRYRSASIASKVERHPGHSYREWCSRLINRVLSLKATASRTPPCREATGASGHGAYRQTRD